MKDPVIICPFHRPALVHTRESFARYKCDRPGCTECAANEVLVKSACHPAAGLEAEYRPKTGHLRLTCRECRGYVCDVAVAPN